MTDRLAKVNSTLREVLAEEIGRLTDTRLEMVTVTAVDTASDLRNATVYVDVLGEGRAGGALSALARASKRLQAAVGSQVRMKYTPTLEFALDPGIVGGQKIDAILKSLAGDRGTEQDDV